MKAAYIKNTGTPDVIRFADIPPATPDAGEVRIRVQAVSVNPIDTYIRSGAIASEIKDRYIIGCDASGMIDVSIAKMRAKTVSRPERRRYKRIMKAAEQTNYIDNLHWICDAAEGVGAYGSLIQAARHTAREIAEINFWVGGQKA